MRKILVINPGSTSTKIAIFEDMNKVGEVNLKMDENFVRTHSTVMEQAEYRTELVRDFLKEHGYAVEDFDIIAARGGYLPSCKGGIYAVNQLMLDVLKYAPQGQHASSLAAVIGYRLCGGKKPVIICDSISVDEMLPVAKVTGLPMIKRKPVAHVLNSRYAAREVAGKLGKDFENSKYIVCHMGGGCSVNAYDNGKLVDTTADMMTPQRAGNLPNGDLVDLCFSGEYTQAKLHAMLIPEGGFYAYLGTQDAMEVENRAKAGDKLCRQLYEAMAYQINKCIGSMVMALGGDVDALVLTGALARSELLVKPIKAACGKVLHIEIIPGERELEALADGAIAALDGTREVMEYDVIPERFSNADEFYKFVESQK